MLAAGADPNAANREGKTALHVAAMTGHLDLARRLLAAGAVREGRLLGAEGGSPLALALFYAQTEMGRFLADPPVPDNLRHAAALGRDITHFFHGDELTEQARDGLDFYRPLTLFPEWTRTFSRQEILDEALTWAVRNDQIESMERLVACGADVNSNPYRGTPLTWAAYADKESACRWLLERGADPNLRHDFGGAEHGKGAVAMHLAAQHGSVRCLKLLLEHGGDPTIRDAAFDGTPQGWAEYGGAVAAAEILRQFGQG